MPEFEENGYIGLWMPGQLLTGEFGLAVLAKRRFYVDLASAQCEPSDDTLPFVVAPEPWDEEDAANSSIRQPAELALAKPKVDILVRGTAFAPGGKPVPQFEVGLKIAGVVERRLRILGPRVVKYVAPKKMLSRKQREKGEEQEYPLPLFSKAAAIDKLPLRYEFAYGGYASLVLDDFVQEMADEAQEEHAETVERKERQKEIEEELRAEEAATEAAAQAKADEGKITDEVAKEKADSAFSGGVTSFIDADVIKRIDAEEAAGEDMEIVSALRLGRDLPDRPEEAVAEATDEETGEGDEAEDEAAPEAQAGPEGGFSEGTAVIDLAEFEAQATRDELAGTLDERHAEAKRQLTDGEGTMLVRTDGMGDVKVTDDAWIDEAGKRPEPKKVKEVEESPYPQVPYPANPSGKGFCACELPEAVDGLELPQIEYVDKPLTPEELIRDLTEMEFAKEPAIAGFAAYPLAWYPRAGLAGVMPWDLEGAEKAKQSVIDELDPDDPDNAETLKALEEMEIPVMQPGWYQEAHPWLQVDRINGNEDVYLDNLTPDGNLFFRLPGTHPTATIDTGRGPTSVFMDLDTVLIDLDDAERPAVELRWRGWFPLRDLEQIEEFTRLKVTLGEVDQVDYMDLKREEETEPVAEGGVTRAVKAMTDEEAEAHFVQGEGADRKYKDIVAKTPDSGEVGAPKDEGGTAIIDLDGEHKLTDDWEDEYRDGQAEVAEDAAERAAAQKKEKERALKKKAREKADEEFGIERDEEEEDEDET